MNPLSLKYLSVVAARKLPKNISLDSLPKCLKKEVLSIKKCCIDLMDKEVTSQTFIQASKYGHIQCINKALKVFDIEMEDDVDINLRRIMIKVAIQNKHFDIVYCLDKAIDAAHMTYFLIFMVKNNYLEMFNFLIELCDLTICDKVIEAICDLNRIKFLNVLETCHRGYNVRIPITYSNMPKLIASGHFKCLRYLLKYGSEPTEQCMVEAIKFSPKTKRWLKQPLESKMACSKYLVSLLLEHNCPVGLNSVMASVNQPNDEIIKMVTDKHNQTNINYGGYRTGCYTYSNKPNNGGYRTWN